MTDDHHMGLERTNRLLKEKILRWCPRAGQLPTVIQGLTLSRREDMNKLDSCFYKPTIGLIIQGFKRSIIGIEEFRYGQNHCLVVGVDMPSLSHLTVASPERPFLAVSLSLDKYLITRLATEIPASSRPESQASPRGMMVAEVDSGVLDAFLRLTELLEKPGQIPILAPLIIREIHYRLLIGPHGECLRMINTHGTQSNQISRAINWLRDNYREPLQVEALAKKLNMATSTFHRHFRQVTTLSPLQFQKRLRLYEAQRLMLTNDRDASTAALEVGYESATQFNREYKRLFGDPPHRDVSRLKMEVG